MPRRLAACLSAHGWPRDPHACSGQRGGELRRVQRDIDLVTERGRGKALSGLMVGSGYEPDRRFNGINAGRRGLYHDRAVERQVDVFLGSFEMCHQLPIAARLKLEDRTLPFAELMLTKLQIVKLNEKDLRDILLLLTHPVGRRRRGDHQRTLHRPPVR